MGVKIELTDRFIDKIKFSYDVIFNNIQLTESNSLIIESMLKGIFTQVSQNLNNLKQMLEFYQKYNSLGIHSQNSQDNDFIKNTLDNLNILLSSSDVYELINHFPCILKDVFQLNKANCSEQDFINIFISYSESCINNIPLNLDLIENQYIKTLISTNLPLLNGYHNLVKNILSSKITKNILIIDVDFIFEISVNLSLGIDKVMRDISLKNMENNFPVYSDEFKKEQQQVNSIKAKINVSRKIKKNIQINEPIRMNALKLYHSKDYRAKNGLNGKQRPFAAHFCMMHNQNLYKENPNLLPKDYLKESTVVAWIKASLEASN